MKGGSAMRQNWNKSKYKYFEVLLSKSGTIINLRVKADEYDFQSLEGKNRASEELIRMVRQENFNVNISEMWALSYLNINKITSSKFINVTQEHNYYKFNKISRDGMFSLL